MKVAISTIDQMIVKTAAVTIRTTFYLEINRFEGVNLSVVDVCEFKVTNGGIQPLKISHFICAMFRKTCGVSFRSGMIFLT